MTQDPFRFFIAGIIQGSFQDDDITSQSYRTVIRALLNEAFPECDVYCPVEHHPDSIKYSDAEAKSTFMTHIDKVMHADAMVAYVPEASMGSAIEMWEAWHHHTFIVTISPMRTNWVIRLFSHYRVDDLKEFEHFLKSGVLHTMIVDHQRKISGENLK